MKTSMKSALAAATLTTFMSVQAHAQKPPRDRPTAIQSGTEAGSVPRPKNSKALLGGLVIRRFDATRDSTKNAIIITGVVGNTSPFRIDRVTWTFSRLTGGEWVFISGSDPGTIEAKTSVTTQCAIANSRDALKFKLEVRSATTNDSDWREFDLGAVARHSYRSGRSMPSTREAGSTRAQRDKQLPGGIDTVFAWPNVVKFAAALVDQRGLGDGQCTRLVEAALASAGAKTGNNYVWGMRENPGQKILPGFVIQFTSCVFRDKASGSSWHLGIPNHTAIVEKASGTRVTLLHQNVDGEPAEEKSHVRRSELDLAWLESGTYTIYCPVVK